MIELEQCPETQNSSHSFRLIRFLLSVLLFAACCFLCSLMIKHCFFLDGTSKDEELSSREEYQIMDRFNQTVSEAADKSQLSLLLTPKRYWIPSDVKTPPVPNPDKYGTVSSPEDLANILKEAETLLAGQKTVFNTDTPIMEDSEIHYYLDNSILAITWKQVFGNFVYTVSEIKIADASQLRRYIAGESYGSSELLVTSRMASKVNAVVASSGDFYMGRKHGISVYDGTVFKANSCNLVDTCFIDRNGDLLFKYRGELTGKEDAQAFADENGVSFSLSFGPVLVDNFERCEPADYALGEVNRGYPRAALCQMDQLHYLVIAANLQGMYQTYPSIHTFASWVSTFGCEKAYALDGGQTAVIVTDNKVINKVQFNFERKISDIFYFSTAIPNVK